MTNRRQRRRAKITKFVYRIKNIPLNSADDGGRNYINGGKTRYNYHESNAEVCIFRDFIMTTREYVIYEANFMTITYVTPRKQNV